MRIVVYRNGAQDLGKEVTLDPEKDSFDQVLDKCAAVLGLEKALRVYTPQGGELEEVNEFFDDDELFVSQGESFLDPSPQQTPSQIVKGAHVVEGYLMKLSSRGLVKTWKKRWFVLRDEKLFYYATQDDTSKEIGYIDLKAVTSITPIERRKDSHWEFVINTPQRNFQLQAFSQQELDYWVHGLSECKRSIKVSPASMAISNSLAAPQQRKWKKREAQIECLTTESNRLKTDLKTLIDQLFKMQKSEMTRLLVALGDPLTGDAPPHRSTVGRPHAARHKLWQLSQSVIRLEEQQKYKTEQIRRLERQIFALLDRDA